MAEIAGNFEELELLSSLIEEDIFFPHDLPIEEVEVTTEVESDGKKNLNSSVISALKSMSQNQALQGTSRTNMLLLIQVLLLPVAVLCNTAEKKSFTPYTLKSIF